MKVYRIEGEDGVGAFRNGLRHHYDDHHRCRSRWHNAGDPPNPKNDGIRGFLSGPHYCGFRSKAQLRRWFRSAAGRRAMAAKGGKLVVYECPDKLVLHGEWQVVFEKAKARQVAVLDLVSLR